MNSHSSNGANNDAIHVLVVDDDPFIRNMVRRLLEKMGIA